MKITTTTKKIESTPKTHVRVVVTEDKTSKIRERKDGITEMVFGVGKFKEISPQDFRLLVRKIVRSAMQQKFEKIALQLDKAPFPQLDKKYNSGWVLSAISEEMTLADYEFETYKSDTSELPHVKEILVCGGMTKDEAKHFERGKILGTYVNHARTIANTSGGDMTPELLAKAAKQTVKGTSARVSVLDPKQIKQLKMGLLEGVARGSRIGPRFIIIEYWGAGKPTAKNKGKKQPLVFVGKGITFDTGGLNIKPGDSMLDMHLDMSGGATVIAAVAAAAKLKIKENIIGLIPAAENAVSDESIRPGDVLTSMSGKTVDVLNTDAEGRLVLADALTYAKRYNPRLVVDVATLTGAALVALGDDVSGVLSPTQDLSHQIAEIGERSGDRVWPLPLWKVHKQYMKGRFGDVANLRTEGNGRYAGTCTAGGFLWYFTEDYDKKCKWAHIDMAPRMTSSPRDNLAKGSTGEPVRLLVTIAESYA